MATRTYYLSKRAPLLWFVAAICILTSVFTTVLTLQMNLEEDLHDYSSVTTMRLWQAVFIIMGNLLTLTMLWISGKYVLRISVTDGEQVEIQTWSMLLIKRTYQIAIGDIIPGSLQFHSGRTHIPGRPIVNAPWESVRTKQGNRFIIDMQGEFPHGPRRYMELLNGIVREHDKTNGVD